MSFKPFKNLLFGFAFSPSLKANVYEVARLASYFNANLILVHVGKKTREKEQSFNNLLNKSPSKPKNIKTHWIEGDPVKTLIKACLNFNVDLLLLGALKREKLVTFYLGSIARKLTRKAPCSVLLMLNPSVERQPCKHIVVNGFDSAQTKDTVEASFYFGNTIGAEKITLVEEIDESRVNVSVNDDKSLREATIKKEKINREEKMRVSDLVKKIPLAQKSSLKWNTQSIFGRRGYSIGHYARIVRADLLIMNAQEESTFINRFFPKDLEHILAELPTDVLIIQS
jgi:nucleotide-binding universal stress UspA family protein